VAVNATPDTRWGYDQRLTAVCDVALVDGQAVVQVENAGGVDIEDRGTAARPVAAVRRAPDGGGLRYELLLPWALLRPDPALRPGDRRELRMEIAVRDNDGGVLKGAMAWGAGCLVDETPLPQWMGQLYLLDISAERIERYRKVVARIPDMPETRSYLQMILASMRGPRAAQDQLAELQSFVKTHPASRNTPRALMTIRTLQKELGEADPHARTAAVAREAGCPAPVVEWIMGKRQEQDRGSGLEAEYYDNADFTDLKITRVDPEINFDWTTKPPGGAMGPDHFSVRWTGQVKPRYSEKYTFFTRSDDGVRLWVDDKLLVDNWTDHAATEDSGEIALIAGMKYDVKLEYYQGGGNAIIALGWASANQKQEVIPHECLFAGDMPPAPATGEAPNKATEEQAAYRDAARLLPDAPEGWALLRQVLARYPADAQETRTTECIRYLKEFPDSVNAVAIMQALRGWYTKPNAPDRAAAAHAARKACEEIMESCKLPRDARRAFYRDCVPAWDQWHALGPVQAGGDQRGMEEVMEPERGVNLAWQAKGPLDVPLVWIKIQRLKDEWRTNGVTDLYQWLVGRLPPEKRNEFDRAPYFAYAWRTVNCPTARRATLFFGVNDTVSIWLNRQRIVTQSSPGATKDGRAIEINLRQGENEILLKAGTPAWGRLHFFLRIADPDGRPFEDLPTE
jgi:hypothetical protein